MTVMLTFMGDLVFIRNDLHYGGKLFISGILFRPCDLEITCSDIHNLNTQLRLESNLSQKLIFLPTWKPFTFNNCPREDHFQLFYPSGRVDGVHLNALGIQKLRQYFKQKINFHLGKSWCDGCTFAPNMFIKKPVLC